MPTKAMVIKMPGNILSVDTGFPNLKQGNPEEKISVLAGYVYQLLEQLRYTLNNLGQENFNDTELKGLEKLFTGPLTVRVEETEKGVARLEIAADEITATVENLEKDFATVKLTVEGLKITTKDESDLGTSALSGMSLYFYDDTGEKIIGRVNMDNKGDGKDESRVRMFVGTGTDSSGNKYSLKLESAGDTSYEGKDNVYIKATGGSVHINGNSRVRITAGDPEGKRFEVAPEGVSFGGTWLASVNEVRKIVDEKLKAYGLIS